MEEDGDCSTATPVEANLVESAPNGEETHLVQQFTDEDFKYGAEQFDVDYLEGISSEANADPNQLSRKSLFVKFDPLVGSSAPVKSATAARLAEINENENIVSPVEKPKKKKPGVSFASDLLVMDTPPRRVQTQVEAPVAAASPVTLLSDITTMAAPSTTERMYSEEEVAKMIEEAKLDEIEKAAKKYEPELSALRQELRSLEEEAELDGPGGSDEGVVDEFQLVDVILTGEQTVLEREKDKWKLLLAEHQRFETLLEFLHDKLKKKFESLAEKRDSLLKSDKIKTKSFEDLQQRYLKMQEAAKNLYKAQDSLAVFKKKTRGTSENLKNISEDCLLKQDELNRTYESLQSEVTSKIAAEKAFCKTLEMQVASLEKNLEQKENETKQLTQIAQELMQTL